MNPKILLDEDTAALTSVLAALLEARRVELDRSSSDPHSPLESISAAELLAQPVVTRDASIRRNLADRPVSGALELALRSLGEGAHAAGIDLNELADAACEANPGNIGRCHSILNSKWDGIGAWHA